MKLGVFGNSPLLHIGHIGIGLSGKLLNSIVSIFALSGLLSTASVAQMYPTKPVTIIVPYAAGGIADVSARLMAKEMSSSLGQPFVIENRVGAGGLIGMEAGARATPDGYTLTYGSQALAIRPHIAPMRFDPMKDITPISMVLSYSQVLVVPMSSPIKTLDDLVAAAKKTPGQLSYGTTGVGGASHLASEMLASATSTRFLVVPYSGGAPALTALLGGHINWMFDTVQTAAPHIQAGRLRAIGYAGTQRNALLPEVPTIAESITGFSNTGWFGLYAPSGTPLAIIQMLSTNVQKIVKLPSVRQELLNGGVEVEGTSSEAFSSFISDQSKIFGKLIKDANIKPTN